MRRVPSNWGDGGPYDVPAVAAIEELALDAPVTLLTGDNGSGKYSDDLEAVRSARGVLGAPDRIIYSALEG